MSVIHKIQFVYLNHRDELGLRTVTPETMWFGISEYYSELGYRWFLQAYDHDKNAKRDFMIERIVGGEIAKQFDDIEYFSVRRWKELLGCEQELAEYQNYVTTSDTLPNGHVILEQAEVFASSCVSQTVRRPDGTEYERIVDCDEAYSPFRHGREPTMVKDTQGRMICVGDIVQHAIQEPFQDLHGTWGQYVVEKAPGGYRLSYWTSEKGNVMPKGYTGGYMSDFVMDMDDKSIKQMVFATVPINSKVLTIVSKVITNADPA